MKSRHWTLVAALIIAFALAAAMNALAGPSSTRTIGLSGGSVSAVGAWNFASALTGDLTVDTSTFKVDSTNDRVGVGTASPAFLFQARKDQDASTVASIQNGSTGSSARASLFLSNSATSGELTYFSTGSGALSGTTAANSLLVKSPGANGLSLAATDSSGDIRLYSGGTTVRATLEETGALNLGSSSAGSLLVGDTSATGSYLAEFGTFSSTTTSTLTGTTQFAVGGELNANSAATSRAGGGGFGYRTQATAFTLGAGYGVRVLTPAIGAGSTVTRNIGLGFQGIGTSGANNAYITDNETFSGNYFLHSTSSDGSVLGGSLAIGQTGAADASALLEVESTTKGILFPRMTTTQRDNISSPASGLVIYNTSTSKLNVYNGAWVALDVASTALTTPGSADKIARATVTCSSSSSIGAQGGTWISSIGNISSGACAITFSGTPFSTTGYACTVSTSLSNTLYSVAVQSKTTSGFTIEGKFNSSGTTASLTSYTADLICMGPA
jgi:hypothetical protein